MPDDQMSGLRSVFARVDEEVDETADLPRPATQQGLGGLSRLAERAGEMKGVDVDPAPLSAIGEEESGPASVRANSDSTSAPSHRKRRYEAATELKRKTSFSLPAELRARISTAYNRDRWTIADLVGEAIVRVQSGRISNLEIERSVKELSSQVGSSIKNVNLPIEHLTLLDELANSMRLSRSQLISATVSIVLKAL